jgi:hypothetical protein
LRYIITFIKQRICVLTHSPSQPNQPITIALPSLVHRIGGQSARELKEVALQHHCVLARVRRSRHWQLVGRATHVDAFIESIDAFSVENKPYLIKKLRQGLAPYEDLLVPLEEKLRRLLQQNPATSISQLVANTHCTEAEARRAVLLFDDI